MKFSALIPVVLLSSFAFANTANKPEHHSFADCKTGPTLKLSACPAVQDFINTFHAKYPKLYSKKQLSSYFDTVKLKQIKKVSKIRKQQPEKHKPWTAYVNSLVNKQRIVSGTKFIKTHKTTFNNVNKTYGVDPGVIAATIGIESNFSRLKGSLSVLSVLSNFAFRDPSRQIYYTKELTAYFKLTHELGVDPTTLKGSYAGAIGIPQFMPYNYLRYGVKYNKASKDPANLKTNFADAIASIGNFYKQHGWMTNEPVVIPIKLHGNQWQKLNDNKYHTLSDYFPIGIMPDIKQLRPGEKAKLLIFDKDKPSQQAWLAFKNFYVIRKYNPSNHYAMAVYELAQKYDQARH